MKAGRRPVDWRDRLAEGLAGVAGRPSGLRAAVGLGMRSRRAIARGPREALGGMDGGSTALGGCGDLERAGGLEGSRSRGELYSSVEGGVGSEATI